MTKKDAIDCLKVFVKALVQARVKDDEGFRKWRSRPENEALMARLFRYEREGDMPAVTAVVKPFFHPELPLIGLNYTPVAHNTLHKHHSGWTEPLRLCRGIVFSRRAALVALPFEKFFNYGEHAETSDLSAYAGQPFSATLKQDGHLAIIFRFQGKVVATTRGSFLSSSSLLANAMLSESRSDNLSESQPESLAEKLLSSGAFGEDLTLLCELIHPDTHVIVDYGGRQEFVLIGARNRRTLEDYDWERLSRLGKRLGLTVTSRWQGQNLDDLLALVKQPQYSNEEGFVVRFADGRRIKFKNAGYISMMLGEKLNHRYVMLRLIDGSFEKRFADLDGEVKALADKYRSELMAVFSVPVPTLEAKPKKKLVDPAVALKKARLAYLYGLVPEEESTPYYRGICRQFLSHQEKQENE